MKEAIDLFLMTLAIVGGGGISGAIGFLAFRAAVYIADLLFED